MPVRFRIDAGLCREWRRISKAFDTDNEGRTPDPCNYDLLYALYALYMNQNDHEKSKIAIEKLKSCYPNDQRVNELYRFFLGGSEI